MSPIRVKQSVTEVCGVELTHPDKVLFPDSGITKAAVAEYYELAAPFMLPELSKRPLAFLRCPHGRGHCFIQKHPGGSGYDQIPHIKIREKDSAKSESYLYFEEAEHLVYAVQQNCLEFHPWASRIPKIEFPDRIIFDLDPGPGITGRQVVALAHIFHRVLSALKLASFVRVSGGKGVHIVIPVEPREPWARTYEWARGFAQMMATEHPETVTMEMSKLKRRGKIFIDYLRNNRGATAVGSLVVRARRGAPVAMPLDWSELTARTRFDGYSLPKVRKLLSGRWNNPWKDIGTLRQRLPHL